MSVSTPQWCVGTPAAFCHSYEHPLPLPSLAANLREEQPHLVWLDSARPHRLTGRYSILGWDPWLILSATGSSISLTTSRSTRRALGSARHSLGRQPIGYRHSLAGEDLAGSVARTRGNPLMALRALLEAYPGCYADDGPPVGVGWLLLLSYDLNRWIERLPAAKPAHLRLPQLRVYGMRMLVVVDHVAGRSWCVSLADPCLPPEQAKRQAGERLEAFEDRHLSHAVPPISAARRSLEVTPTMTQRAFETRVRRAQRFIRAGDIFQANLSQEFLGCGHVSPWALYLALRAVNPSPFACFVQCPEGAVVSCSPERLIQVRDGWASTRPIAGTRPRGVTAQEDAVNSLELLLSEKERAEHVMLVDLERNDLGRVCRPGSVAVDEFMGLEDYSHVMHIVSNVRGRLAAGAGAVDVIRAMFPGGTITGCPKVRCMEILRELEPGGRGLYTGSAGYVGFNGAMDFNILIRTIVTDGAGVSFHVGAGIVADSQPDREYHETLAKGRALIQALRRVSRAERVDAAA